MAHDHAHQVSNQLTRDRTRLQNQIESLLEDAHLKLGICVSDLLRVSSRRMMRASAKGETDPKVLAGMAEENLQATPEALEDALSAASRMDKQHRQTLKLFLDRLDLVERHLQILQQQIARAARPPAGRRVSRLTWLILHHGVEYIEYGAERNLKALQKRTRQAVT